MPMIFGGVSRARLALVAVSFVSAATLALPSVAQNPQPVRVRGTVASLDGTTLVVKSREGNDVTIQLNDNWGAGSVVKASMADIKPGTYVGIAALPDGDGLKSLEVLVFPEALRGTAEGHFPWDLKPNRNMSNGTVGDAVQSVDGRTITVSYKGGEKKLVVPNDVPIVTLGPADRSDVKPGVAVFIITQRSPEGTLKAGRVTVGKDGVNPPM
jgi:hypothetical protein